MLQGIALRFGGEREIEKLGQAAPRAVKLSVPAETLPVSVCQMLANKLEHALKGLKGA
jgi:hypothetical protein